MKIAVIGSRSITDYPLEQVIPPDASEIISGGARGVGSLAREYALQKGIPCTEIRPDYRPYGKGAPLRHNKAIIAQADLVIAIWDGESTGTAYSLAYAHSLGKQVLLVQIETRQTP